MRLCILAIIVNNTLLIRQITIFYYDYCRVLVYITFLAIHYIRSHEMKENLTNEDYSLGNLEAWEQEERDNLPINFLSIKQYSLIADSDNIFLCGRRGTGKSAIALMLEMKEPYKYKCSIPGESQNYGQYLRIVKQLSNRWDINENIDLRHTIRCLWQWVLPVLAMQVVLCKSKNLPKIFNEVKIIKAYFNTLPAPLYEKSTIGHLLGNIFQEANNILNKEGVVAFDTYLLNLTGTREFNSAIEATHNIVKDNKIFLVIDTIESYKIFDPFMTESFQGILDAITSLCGDSKVRFITLKLFIPAEMFEPIFEKYPGKVSSRAVFMRWRAQDLTSILARRFLNVLSRTEAVPSSDINKYNELIKNAYDRNDGRLLRKEFWYNTKFMPKYITNRMGNNEDSFAYMLRHTQRRPRDMIAMLQSIINVSREIKEFPFISEQSLYKGIHNKQLLSHIVAEALTPYEGKIPAKLMSGSRSIFYNRPTIMSGHELKKFSNELYSIAPLDTIDPADFLSILVKCGIIGLIDESEKGYGKEIYIKAKFDYIHHETIAISDRLTYCLHPAVADLFQMKPPEQLMSAIYPYPDPLEDHWIEDEVGIL